MNPAGVPWVTLSVQPVQLPDHEWALRVCFAQMIRMNLPAQRVPDRCLATTERPEQLTDR